MSTPRRVGLGWAALAVATLLGYTYAKSVNAERNRVAFRRRQEQAGVPGGQGDAAGDVRGHVGHAIQSAGGDRGAAVPSAPATGVETTRRGAGVSDDR
ncbi:hypothetical protein Q5752_003653 [Cryptotrichosporon argae]